MGKINCTVEYGKHRYHIEAASGTRLLDLLNTIEGLTIDAPCGGQGVCGKCKVEIRSPSKKDGVNPPDEREQGFLSSEELELGIRLSCRARLIGNCRIRVLSSLPEANILSDFAAYGGVIAQAVGKFHYSLAQPSLDDMRPDDERILDRFEESGETVNGPASRPGISLELRKSLTSLLRDSEYDITVTADTQRIYKVEPGDTSNRHYGMAVDIGTTTVVAYLLSLTNGELIHRDAQINRQKSYGADVLSRIDYTENVEGGLEELGEKIRSQIEQMGEQLLAKKELRVEDVSMIAVTGNTTMIHLFLGLDPRGIASAPFIPSSLKPGLIKPEESVFEFSEAPLYVLPSISAFVGGDVSAGILASGLSDGEDPSLLIDLGTNGEIAVGNKNRLYACSTAAGPAFEGAQISRGMGSVAGAINRVFLEDGRIAYTTIGGQSPRGICGSGIFDITALLVSSGVVDYTGRILSPGELSSDSARKIGACIVEEKNEAAIEVVPREETGDEAILFTQRDLREVQLAKAAIAAGIEALLYESRMSYKDIARIYISGGFGNYIDPLSAVRIGILPLERLNSIEPIGNSSGKGAVLSLLSQVMMEKLDRIAAKTEYIELSTSTFFQEAYIRRMYFESMKIDE